MNNALFSFPRPANEPIFQYLKGSKERELLMAELKRMSSEKIEIPLIIGGKEVRTGNTVDVVMPHNNKKVIAVCHMAGEKEVEMAIEAAMAAKKQWENLPWTERASITLKIAELISTKYRPTISAATMLGQGKNIYQSEIDAVCEAADFLRFNAHYASQIYANQPGEIKNQLNRMEYRALEGFVFALTPFNFTAIASNLNMSPALMGNVTVWKPSTTAVYSNYHLMKIYKEAGLPDGVVNFVPGKGSMMGKVILASKHFAGLHFTGSTATFNTLWKGAANNVDKYVSYPRIVGETGGKDFIFVHKSAQADEVANAIVCGSFEYQGQKCSAASRVYMPKSLWSKTKEILTKTLSTLKMGDVNDPDNFINAVIDEASFDNIMRYIQLAKDSKECEIIAGGKGDKSVGYFVEPTVIVTTNPRFTTMEEEIFGPVVTIYVYEDDKYEETLEICNTTSPYGLTGSIFSRDIYATQIAVDALRYAAGNFYINDKPTGAMVGLQPFGGARASGTNDKAGGSLNLIRWVNARAIKETFVSPTDHRYGYMK
ncbi:MAG: L-glutamate gamma-semialdehyde dehydrogenase [Bacteroidales bacterium]|jgi:1-pyrroline-5-carboxylate dehydrogenase|nr:L-glutamate gamma-semialdehyde dehydrogenase [Bacteroidales bacterium]OQC46925.1 MAG: 1-pyrroline-5-carboxylate dehydrogenase [Bacteroidetes bacterium ADurb.Bin028]NLP19413.1 L-glutamate gamma-semialdehyde dehydrogenase [Bacteroidales bacterium]HNY43114.1 L-glutamate gamma-semialdehyde dehydrogenase [Bacteroidales bacterium]HOD88374.1 L-glutamate gamma-semialdehyde dehydrogenase [Bacteroidales bacterium]